MINFFVQTHRLTFFKTKSVLVQQDKKSKNTIPCAKVKVHNADMKEAGAAKFLGNFVSSSGGSGGVRETISRIGEKKAGVMSPPSRGSSVPWICGTTDCRLSYCWGRPYSWTACFSRQRPGQRLRRLTKKGSNRLNPWFLAIKKHPKNFLISSLGHWN